jgi:uncharacterized protein YkwD
MYTRVWRLFFIFTLAFVFAFPPGAKSQAGFPLALPPTSAYDLIAEVNALRASNGLPGYNIQPLLMQIAQAHAEYQAAIGTVTHYSADGSRPFQRALAAGYPVAGNLSLGGFFSENIVSGSGLSPAGAVSSWMEDAPHMNTMLSPTLQDVGAGVSTSGGITYYTLDAGLASGSPISYTPPAGGTAITPGTPGTPVEFIQPVVISTPREDGNVYHEVQAGQALWSIALAYNTTVDQIKLLNNLTSDEIFVGQKLLIDKGQPPTSTPGKPTPTVTIGVPFSTATRPVTPTPTNSFTPVPTPPASPKGGGLIAGAIVMLALIAAGIGTWLSVKKPL